MRIPAILAGTIAVLAACGATAASYSEADLITVAAQPELVPFATKVRDLLQLHRKACDAVVKMNAFPQGGNVLLAVVHCSSGQRYEALLGGPSTEITQVP